MPLRARPGQRIPYAALAELHDGEISLTHTEQLFAGRSAVVMGMPGAFTPVCSQQHLPNFIGSAERLKAAGYQMLICICPNDPWVIEAWARQIDPQRRIRFLSDGNLELTRKLGLVSRVEGYHLGDRSERYTMILRDAVIEKLAVEQDILQFSCTTSDAVLL